MAVKQEMGLVQFNKARRELAKATKIDEVKDVRDKAEALRLYAKQSGQSLEMQNKCAEIKIRAERRGGEILKETEKAKGGGDTSTGVSVRPVQDPPTLADIGISKTQSSRWQKTADIPEEIFEQHIEQAKEKKSELTSKGIGQLANKLEREKAREENKAQVESNPNPKPLENHYQTIVADPPWDISEMGDNEPFARSEPTYASMTIQEIKDEDIGKYAAENCHLYLWVINRMIFKSEAVLKAWGFRYITLLTWCKPTIGMGNYFRNNTEHMLFGVKGSLALLRNDVGTWLNAPRGSGGHSSKPNEFYELIQTCSPGPRLDYFAREERQGWDVYVGEL